MYSCVRFMLGSAPALCSLLGSHALPRAVDDPVHDAVPDGLLRPHYVVAVGVALDLLEGLPRDRKSTRLNSSHANLSYAVFCLKKKKQLIITRRRHPA